MKRRNFFKAAALSGGTLALSPLSSCEPTTSTEKSEPNYIDFELNEMTIAELQEKMSSGKLTSEEITKKYLGRIEQINTKGPELRAVIELNPDALIIAIAMDAERKGGKVRGPMHGIPVLIKDNIDTGDKMQTSAGSLALVGAPAPDDANLVRKLRESGAVLLGKTNLSEWANFRSTKSSSGWSGRGGQVRNPFCTDRSPCGSSSGTGSAVSANLCAIGIGTETNGSIVCPSGINGIVGIKPTVGLWSGDGIVPISHSQDTAGPMARTVSDAAILLGQMVEHKPENPLIFSDYTPFLDANGLLNARIGVASDFLGFNSDVDILMNEAINIMKKHGAVIVENLKFEKREEWSSLEWPVLLTEFKEGLNAYLKTRPNLQMQSLVDLIEFNKKNSTSELEWFGQEIFELAEATKGINDPEYRKLLYKLHELTREQGIDKLMNLHLLDALIAPTNGPSWTIDLVNGDHYTGGSSDPAAISGYPSITVPVGFVKKLPIGLSFFGSAWSESKLIKLAYAFEQATKHRKLPEFILTNLAD